MKKLFTIGYEGASVADLISTLELSGIQHLVDVREVAQSRRPGFSKNGLAAALRESNIGYSHAKQLGDPKEGRDAARRGDLKAFRKIFEVHLQLEATRAALEDVAAIASTKATVLLCFERDPRQCHRALVARDLSAICSLNVQNLGVVRSARQRSRTTREAA